MKKQRKAEIKDYLLTATVKIGEKLDLRRFEIVEASEGQAIGTYHHMKGKISVLVVTDKACDDVKGLAMHIAANNPLYITKADIPADVLEHEKLFKWKQLRLMKN